MQQIIFASIRRRNRSWAPN